MLRRTKIEEHLPEERWDALMSGESAGNDVRLQGRQNGQH